MARRDPPPPQQAKHARTPPSSCGVGGPAPQTRVRTFTIGTAGHVDHGKSALVHALTGIDPDRLPEEKARGMTLVLGFAPLRLPSGRVLTIVDVPGHESLIRTMAHGAQGMEAVLLCIDGRERVMPQTREHLEILGLLGLSRGIVVLTKADLLDSPTEREATETAVRAALRGTLLHDAPLVWTSARTGEGLPTLLELLDTLIATLPPRPADGPVRLPIDRVFSSPGFGVVVTGTLLSGTLRPGQQLVVLPRGLAVRVRGLEIHHERVTTAWAGERPAVNLAGVESRELRAGDVLADPRAFAPTHRALAELHILPHAPRLPRRAHLEFLSGTATAIGTARPTSGGLEPGFSRPALLLVEPPLVLAHGDVLLVRDTGRSRVVGRARILDPHPPTHLTLQDALTLAAAPTPSDAAAAYVAASGSAGLSESELARKLGLTPQGLRPLVKLHRRYWTQDELIRAREALIRSLPGPGGKLRLGDWMAAAHLPDPRAVDDIARQIIHLFRLRVQGDWLFCPSRATPRGRTRSPLSAPRTTGRAAPLTALELARVLEYAAHLPVVSTTTELRGIGLPPSRAISAIRALAEGGQLIPLGPRYAIHPDALDRALRSLRDLRHPATLRDIAASLRLSRSQAHTLLSYLLRHGTLAFARGRYVWRGETHRPSS